jgi:hypothetical protein
MTLLGDVDQVEACFSMFGDNVTLDARYMHSLRRKDHMLQNQFGRNQWLLYMMRVKWKLILAHLEIVLISTQDRCMSYAERTIGLESFWMHLIVLLGDIDQAEDRFHPFGESFNLRER